MTEIDKIFSSGMSYSGIFQFSDFYQFCYDWLIEETGLILSEEKYSESLKGNAKDLEIVWVGTKEATDYFKFQIKVKFLIIGMTEVEMEKDGKKIKANKGKLKANITGLLLRDYKGKFEKDAFRVFLRSIYEKWIIQSRIDQLEKKLFDDCDEFLGQAKAYLAVEGKR